MEQAKRCSKCKKHKPFSEFSKSKGGKFGLFAYCKVCAKTQKKKYREKPAVKIQEREYQQTYYASNSEKYKAAAKARYWGDLAGAREYYQNNKSQFAERQRKYRSENPELLNARVADWRRRNPHKTALYNNSRRVGYVTDSKTSKATLRERYGDWCTYCGTVMHFDSSRQYDPDFATIEHIVPVSLGGPHAECNVVLVCRRCNLSKGGKSLLEFLLYKVELFAGG